MKEVTGYEIGGKIVEDYVSYVEKFNDSEALAIDIALVLSGKKEVLDAVGTVAFICYETTKKGKMLNVHYGRNKGNPLNLELGKGFFVMKSDKGLEIEENVLWTRDYKTNDVSYRDLEIGEYKTFTTKPNGNFVNNVGFGRYQNSLYNEDEWIEGRGVEYLPLVGASTKEKNLDEDAEEYYTEMAGDLEKLENSLEQRKKDKEKWTDKYFTACSKEDTEKQEIALDEEQNAEDDIFMLENEIAKLKERLYINAD
jgi:hypothetical protein